MPQKYRESRLYRCDDEPSDDEDERYKTTTVRRYKVAPTSRVERIEREVEVTCDDDPSRCSSTRSRHHHRHQRHNHRHGHSHSHGRDSEEHPQEVGRIERIYVPERPRSAMDSRRTGNERERDRDDGYYRVEYGDERRGLGGMAVERVDQPEWTPTRVERPVMEHDDRGLYPRGRDDDYYRIERERERERARLMYEKTKEIDLVNRRGPMSPRGDSDRRSAAPWDDSEKDVCAQRRYEEHRDDPYGAEVKRYRKETEYYEPGPPPIVLRQRAPEQRIIVQEAPDPAAIVPSRPEVQYAVAHRGHRGELAHRTEPLEDEQYYYHREERYEGDYPPEHRHHHHRHQRHHYDDEDEEDVYVKKTIIRRYRSRSDSPNHKRHLAEGALAGAGLSALLASRRNGDGELPEHRGRKVLAGAALGALGTEVVRRAHSVLNEQREDNQDRCESCERSRSRRAGSRIRTGLGIAAVALAGAGLAKMYQENKIEKDELNRGRSLRRYSHHDSRSPSRKRSGSRSMLKAAAGTAAAVGITKHFRHKSKSHSGSKSRSRSRLRAGAEVVAAGLAGAVGKKLYEQHREKRDRNGDSEHERDLTDELRERREHRKPRRSSGHHDEIDRSWSRSLSRARSRPRHHEAVSSGPADPELGMVEYGAHPLHADMSRAEWPRDPAEYYDSAEEESQRLRHRRRHRHPPTSRDDRGYHPDGGSDPEDEDMAAKKKRSKSRLRHMAAVAASASAAAIGIKKHSDGKKDRDGKDKGKEHESDGRSGRYRDSPLERDRDRDRGRGLRDRTSGDRSRDRDRESHRRRYEEETTTDDLDEYTPRRRTPSPAFASGGAYPPPPGTAPLASPDVPPTGSTHRLNQPTTDHNADYRSNLPEFAAFPHPPTGPPPNSAATPMGFPRNVQPGPSGPAPPLGPEHVSEASCGLRSSLLETLDGTHPFGGPQKGGASDPSLCKHLLPYPDLEGLQHSPPFSSDGLNRVAPSPVSPQEASPPPTDSDSENDTQPGAPSTRHVAFVPLSPQWSRKLKRHCEQESQVWSDENEHNKRKKRNKRRISYKSDGSSSSSLSTSQPRQRKGKDDDENRGLSSQALITFSGQPTTPSPCQHPCRRRDSSRDSEPEEEIVLLPDRFDVSGRPFDERGRKAPQWHSRRGSFAYKRERSNLRGHWGVAGTDPEAVERIVRRVTNTMEGQGSWLKFMDGIMSGSLLECPKREGRKRLEVGSDRDDWNKGKSSRHTRNARHDHDGDDDYNHSIDEEKRRRQRGRWGKDEDKKQGLLRRRGI